MKPYDKKKDIKENKCQMEVSKTLKALSNYVKKQTKEKF